jgi:hypothetical protein
VIFRKQGWAFLGHPTFYFSFLGRFWAQKVHFGPLHPLKTGKVIFRKQESVFLGHPHKYFRTVAPPENGESDFPKTRIGVLGTSHILFFIFLTQKVHFGPLHPLKTGKVIFRKQGSVFLGHPAF